MTEASAPAAQPVNPDAYKVIIRPWPKIIFLYPTFIAAVVAGVWQWLAGPGEAPDAEALSDFREVQETVGMMFFLVFALNLLVISFEFSRLKTVAILFFVVAVIFGALFASNYVPVLEHVKNALGGLHLQMSVSFYFTLASYFFLIYALVFINTRWNYWVIRNNEIIHYTGFLGDIKRFPSPNLRMSKTIEDVFEFLLLGSGRITFIPASEREAIVLENVLGVNRVERNVKRLLSELRVKVSAGHHDNFDGDD